MFSPQNARKPPNSPAHSSLDEERNLINQIIKFAEAGNSQAIMELVQSRPKTLLTGKTSVGGNSAILIAATEGNQNVVEYLLQNGVDINSRNDYGWTAFHLAILHGRTDLVRYLLSQPRLKIDHATVFGVNALHLCIRKNDITSLRTLLQRGADVNSANTGALTPLMLASHRGLVTSVSLLLKANPEINAQCRLNGWTALFYAVNSSESANILSMVKQLIHHGADPEVKAMNGKTAIDIAQQKQRMEVFVFLQSLRRRPSAISSPVPSSTSTTAENSIFSALDRENLGQLMTVIQKNPTSVNDRDPDTGFTPLMIATMKNDEATVQLLLQNGARINERLQNGWTALHFTIINNFYELAQYLLTQGALLDLNVEDPSFSEIRGLTTDSEMIDLITKKMLKLQVKKSKTSSSYASSIDSASSPSPQERKSKFGTLFKFFGKKPPADPAANMTLQNSFLKSIMTTSAKLGTKEDSDENLSEIRGVDSFALVKSETEDAFPKAPIQPATNFLSIGLVNTYGSTSNTSIAKSRLSGELYSPEQSSYSQRRPSLAKTPMVLSKIAITPASPSHDNPVAPQFNFTHARQASNTSSRSRTSIGSERQKSQMMMDIVGVDIDQFLASLGLGQYHTLFKYSGVESTAHLTDVNMDWLQSIGIASMEHRRKILEALKRDKEIGSPMLPVTKDGHQRAVTEPNYVIRSGDPVPSSPIGDISTDKLEYLRSLKQRARERQASASQSSFTMHSK